MCRLKFKKPEPWARLKARRARLHDGARKACVEKVWADARSLCARCGRLCVRYTGANELAPNVGHVDEIIPRSQGGSDVDPTNCRLLCRGCHFSGASGAHRRTVRRHEVEPGDSTESAPEG